MKEFTITPPNTCGLVIRPAGLIYVSTVGAITFAPDESTFEEFLTADDAAARAVEIDPGFDLNLIYGPLNLTPVNISDGNQSAYVGDSVTLNCEYACEGASISYQWLNPGNLPIPGATQSHLTLNNLTEKLDGTYTCNVSTSNEKGQTGSASGSFNVMVYPAITPGASEPA